MPIKVTMIGAGSLGFTRRLMHDILSIPELADTRFSFTDVSQENLEKVTSLCQRDIRENRLPAAIESTPDRKKALEGADYVITTFRHGGLDALKQDIYIPLDYGVDQCVGDTLCPGGLMYAQRMIPVLLDICAEIREVSNKDSLLLNYSNPMAMNTWACLKYGKVQTVGLCHGVQHSHKQITDCIEHWARQNGLIGETESIPRDDVTVIASGINHQTWFIKAEWRGIDFIPRLLELFEAHPVYSKTEKLRIDVLRRFGHYSTESNGHLSEYLPWYRKNAKLMDELRNPDSWLYGDIAGGYYQSAVATRNKFDTEYCDLLEEPVPDLAKHQRSEEHGSFIIEALETNRSYRGHFNVLNHGQIPNLPRGCVIEIPGYVDASGINSPYVGALPLACAATCSATIHVQEMGVEAAVSGDSRLLKQAMLHDPLTTAACTPEQVWKMTDELLRIEQEWLPQYSH